MKKLFYVIGYLGFEGLLLTGLFYIVRNIDTISTTCKMISK